MSKKRRTEYDTHHLINRCNGWSDDPNNLVRMKRKQHEARHILFENEGVKEALINLFLLWEKCLKDWNIKRELWKCLQDLEYKNGVFKETKK